MRVIRVVVVEDQIMLRDSLVAAINRELDMEVVASLADAADVLDLDAGREIDVALLDVCTENNSSGIIAARKLREARPQVKTVIMTGMSDVTFVRQAREAGVDSFIYKNVRTDDLLSVIRSTVEGYSTFPSSRKGDASEVELLDELELKSGAFPRCSRRRAMTTCSSWQFARCQAEASRSTSSADLSSRRPYIQPTSPQRIWVRREVL